METLPNPPAPNPELDPASAQPHPEQNEVMSVVGDQLKLAMHGVLAVVAEKRMERAGKTMERMDHKDALYHDLGSIALGVDSPTAETATGEPARPRTFVERHADKRLEKKSWKMAMKKAIRDDALKKAGGDGYGSTMGIKTKVVDAGRRHNVNKQYRNNELTSFERRVAHDSIDSTPYKAESKPSSKSRKAVRRSSAGLSRAAKQPVLSVWRDKRQERAIGRIKQNYRRTEEHWAAAQNIQDERLRNDTEDTQDED